MATLAKATATAALAGAITLAEPTPKVAGMQGPQQLLTILENMLLILWYSWYLRKQATGKPTALQGAATSAVMAKHPLQGELKCLDGLSGMQRTHGCSMMVDGKESAYTLWSDDCFHEFWR